MHPKEQEIREFAVATPFVPFTLVSSSGERYKVPTQDHIFFAPNVDDDGSPLPDEERSQMFTVFARGRVCVTFSLILLPLSRPKGHLAQSR